METQTIVKVSKKEIEELRSEVVFKQEKIFTEYLNNLVNNAFKLGIAYQKDEYAKEEKEKWVNRIN
jgi:hypothetical protein